MLPSDIAILVNNRQEANRMRSALARRGLRSVYLSDKDTVYETPQATEIYRWLMACANPTDDRLLKAALSTASLGLDFPALEALHRDDTAFLDIEAHRLDRAQGLDHPPRPHRQPRRAPQPPAVSRYSSQVPSSAWL